MKSKENKGNKKLIVFISIILAAVIVGLGVYVVIENDLFGIRERNLKPINQYTLSEYENMTEEEQISFKKRFENEEEFKKWHADIQVKSKAQMPWDNDGKTPDQYTLEEFEALNSIEKIAFSEWFKSEDEFFAWQDKVEQQNKAPLPWEADGAKMPDQYTYDEFSALTGEQQMHFQYWFKSIDDFDKWLTSAQGK